MDKKQMHYSRQGSSKALVSSDSRKSSDVYSSKPLPRNGRRRENPNLSSSKNDAHRSKPGPAKIRTNVDKRPKPRSSGTSIGSSAPDDVSASSPGLATDDKTTVISSGGQLFELNSVYSRVSKKPNLNHLLNFHYSRREYDDVGVFNVFGKHGNRYNSKKHKYNKEEFLQANFQFVIKQSAESQILAASPDTLVDWSLIEQINIQTTEEPQCPICLYPPIAAKLTRCGHAYCWPCILHYLALTDKNWRKCPICYESIHINDLKSTAIVQQANFNVGDSVTLQLMRRKKSSILIEKYTTGGETGEKIPHLFADDDQKKISKFLIAGYFEALSIIEREERELKHGEDPQCPEFVFIQQALDLLKERKDMLEKEIENDEKFSNNINTINNKGNYNTKEDVTSTSSSEKSEDIIEIDMETHSNSKYYYFYQSIDGQNIFLHPLNVKMLQAAYGSLEKGPTIIKANIVQKEYQSMDEYHRKKFSCLGHLPLTCQFEIVEVQLGPPTISFEVLEMFKDDIQLREKTRMKRAKDEKKREKEINKIHDRQMGKLISRTANIDIKSEQQFPACGFDESEDWYKVAYPNELADSPPPNQSPVKNSYASFANVLTSPKKDYWPSLESNCPLKGEPSWLKAPTPQPRKISECGSDVTEDGSVPFPKQSLGDVLSEALQQKQKSCSDGTRNKGEKKGKKNKKTFLFSTGMSFNGNQN